MMSKSIRDGYTSVIKRLTNTSGTAATIGLGDRRDGAIYSYDDDLHLALETALVTGRPLLLRGDPGTGKSSFAPFVARNLNWRYYEQTITSETRARDLLWRYDAVRRLADAQARIKGDPPLNEWQYVDPGILWWAYDPSGAQRRGMSEEISQDQQASDRFATLNKDRNEKGAVILIDELDKADPDVPNALLVPLGAKQFQVRETGTRVRCQLQPIAQSPKRKKIHPLLVVITTNEERALPAAFLRRCVVHRLRHPNETRLVKIAGLHLKEGAALTSDEKKIIDEKGTLTSAGKTLCQKIAKLLTAARNDAKQKHRRQPSTAEFLDAVFTCVRLGIAPQADDPAWCVIERSVFSKPELTVGGFDGEED